MRWEELYRLTGGTFRVHGFITKSHVPGTVNAEPLNYAVMWRALLNPKRVFMANKDPAQVPLLEVEPRDIVPIGGGSLTDGLDTDEAQRLLLTLLGQAKETIRLAALRALGKGASV